MKRVVSLVTFFATLASPFWAMAQSALPPEAPAQIISDVPPQAAEQSGHAPALNFKGANGAPIHILPNKQGQDARVRNNLSNSSSTGNLQYHRGGSIIPAVNIYNIYWLPAPAAGSTTSVLQNGAPTSMASNYKNVLDAVTTGVATSIGATNVYAPDQGESLYNIAAQYYQSLSGKVTYVADSGGLAASVVDTNPYPASGCTDSVTPGNCLTDAQIQTEISKVMTANGWTPGINKIYVMYTSSGEGSCASGSACSYTYYCAYHSAFGTSNAPVVYVNMPYAHPATCQASGQTAPNALGTDASADITSNTLTHEIIEAVTDPLGNAWFDSRGNEIGDKCAWNFGSNSIISSVNGVAENQYFGNSPSPYNYFEMQMEWSNAISGCAQVK
jgi:hypothetical protein